MGIIDKTGINMQKNYLKIFVLRGHVSILNLQFCNTRIWFVVK
jgi:hypothetical protein